VLHDKSPPLVAPVITKFQEITGTLIVYGCFVYPTILVALGTIAPGQTKGTEATEATSQAIIQLLNYSTTHQYATIRYSKSDIYLHVHSYASYVSYTEA
jgi:hypothetical protein